MKNVKDAVEAMGKWSNHGAANWIVYRRVGAFDWWSYWDDTELNETWQRVCTRKEFENE